MHEADCQKIFCEVSLSAIPIGTIHFDTTGMSVGREYSQGEKDAIDVTYGFSKSTRPDLWQIVFGIGSNH